MGAAAAAAAAEPPLPPEEEGKSAPPPPQPPPPPTPKPPSSRDSSRPSSRSGSEPATPLLRSRASSATSQLSELEAAAGGGVPTEAEEDAAFVATSHASLRTLQRTLAATIVELYEVRARLTQWAAATEEQAAALDELAGLLAAEEARAVEESGVRAAWRRCETERAALADALRAIMEAWMQTAEAEVEALATPLSRGSASVQLPLPLPPPWVESGLEEAAEALEASRQRLYAREAQLERLLASLPASPADADDEAPPFADAPAAPPFAALEGHRGYGHGSRSGSPPPGRATSPHLGRRSRSHTPNLSPAPSPPRGASSPSLFGGDASSCASDPTAESLEQALLSSSTPAALRLSRGRLGSRGSSALELPMSLAHDASHLLTAGAAGAGAAGAGAGAAAAGAGAGAGAAAAAPPPHGGGLPPPPPPPTQQRQRRPSIMPEEIWEARKLEDVRETAVAQEKLHPLSLAAEAAVGTFRGQAAELRGLREALDEAKAQLTRRVELWDADEVAPKWAASASWLHQKDELTAHLLERRRATYKRAEQLLRQAPAVAAALPERVAALNELRFRCETVRAALVAPTILMAEEVAVADAIAEEGVAASARRRARLLSEAERERGALLSHLTHQYNMKVPGSSGYGPVDGAEDVLLLAASEQPTPPTTPLAHYNLSSAAPSPSAVPPPTRRRESDVPGSAR